ncbi:YdeI/OmpD-associated family protein [Pseudaestuariivita atlantica]|uniref:YdeI/OmpD-associated family protein n=1 Tax=Pseudaestuariivita atlantica TaxID=1317121 RepID=UPI00067C9CCD|nr:YdeI/OmpD-associated family protein [Pseudaestuariivita atlantica]
MTGYVTFTARIVPMEWGDSTYTVLPLPDDVRAALGPAKRVEGEINEHPVNLAVTRAPVLDMPFLWTGKSLLDEIGIAPGDEVEVRLRPADPDAVDVPRDVTLALRSAGVTDAWDALTPGKRRGLLHTVKTAKRAETRARRIHALIAQLTEG